MKRYEVCYDGFIAVKAKDEDEALDKANAILSKSELPNDGSSGGWFLISVEHVEEE